jgi:dTDP-L-rhamnose 4-epimerase
VPADVTHGPNWDAVLKAVRPTTVVHLAAETGTGQSLTESTRHAMVNGVGTTQMLDGFTRAGHVPEHFVLASSRAVYGEGAWSAAGETFYPDARLHDDLVAGRWDPTGPDGAAATPLVNRAATTEPRPSNVYAATKLLQEHLLAAWSTAMGPALSVLRLQNVYGPGQSLTNSYTGVLTFFSRVALAGEPIDVYEDGAIIRDFVFVGDVVAALAAAVERPPADRRRTVDIGSGEPSTILEVAELMADLRGAPDPKVSGRFRDGDVRAASADIAEAERELAYAPRTKLRDGVAQLLDWAEQELTE